MEYSVAFKNLPFEPDERQVIYVEDQFDEHINAIIKDNYERIKKVMNLISINFVYLPMFFDDEETREKVLYYAPYLTSDIIEKVELRSSYLLGYMSNPENRQHISPSLLYAPRKENDEWIFQCQTIDLDYEDSDYVALWFERIAIGVVDDIISNKENLEGNKDSLNVSADNHNTFPFFPGDIQFHIEGGFDEYSDDASLFRDDDDWDSEEPHVEHASTPNLGEEAKRWLKKHSQECVTEENDSVPVSLDKIREEDINETIASFESNAKRLRLEGVSLIALHELLDKLEVVSRLHITDDLRILLPDYNNIEVRMPALYKAVFLLFIYYKDEGIVLQRLEEHHHELEYLYRKTTNKRILSPRQLESINKLETSYDDEGSIYTVLSRIKSAFKGVIDEHLAKNYYIIGSPGEPYKIALDKNLIEWEDEI